jgi:hypothetical protein
MQVMTDIDTAADIDIVLHEQRATVRIPLAGQVTQDWCRRYQELAEAKGLPARAEVHPGRAWVVVNMPGYTAGPEVLATMDTARDLIARADATEESAGAEGLASAVRDWWTEQRG